jgi:tripartite-type tricarboxylate transporter receptor subunit TctC
MAGVVQMAVANINAIAPLLKGDKLRALAVTGNERSPLLRNVPTASEDGVPGFEFVGWFALMAPAGTPKAVISRVYEDASRAVEQPGMKRYLDEQGMSASITPPGGRHRQGVRAMEGPGREEHLRQLSFAETR